MKAPIEITPAAAGRWTVSVDGGQAQGFDTLDEALEAAGQVVFEVRRSGEWGARVKPPRRP